MDIRITKGEEIVEFNDVPEALAGVILKMLHNWNETPEESDA